MSLKRSYIPLIWLILALLFTGCGNNNPHALIITEDATIEIELFPEKAPLTVQNFIRYCKEGRYKNSSFYRTLRPGNQPGNTTQIELIQGGLKADNHPLMLPPIAHESTLKTGIFHEDGVISMARNEPGTATSEFFICIGSQPELDHGGKRNPDGEGFAAFGKVVEGMEFVKKYQYYHANGQYLEPPVRILDIIITK
ncbi:MAG: peptidylprolyl isomerase [Bacteroidales bacterium]|nr:peptidylprolyl isomerase [Bacteroidales bacterium]